jgi:hypothetical protein
MGAGPTEVTGRPASFDPSGEAAGPRGTTAQDSPGTVAATDGVGPFQSLRIDGGSTETSPAGDDPVGWALVARSETVSVRSGAPATDARSVPHAAHDNRP